MDKRLLSLALGMFALGTDGYVVAGVLPQIAHTYGTSIELTGQLTSIYAITFALLAPTIAAVAAGVARRTMMLSGLAIFVLANLGTAFSPTFAVAMVTRVLAGLGAAMFSPTATGSAALIVAPERRGHALAIVMAGLSAATALGSPIGAVIGGLGDWRYTMGFVSVLAAAATVGVYLYLDHIPLPPAISLARRIAPLADSRILLTLLTTLIAMTGNFVVYTYFAVAFDRVIAGNTLLLSALLVLWGVAGTVSNLNAGKLIDKFGPRKIVVTCLTVLIVDFALFPLTSQNIWAAALAILVWGAACWAILVPQQHRIVSMAPAIAPIVIGLNTSGTYLGITAAGLVGAVGLHFVGPYQLGLVAVIPVVIALGTYEMATRRIHATQAREQAIAVRA